jgi:CubicO group peptidase (beta-lactamase class C family)
MSLNWIPILLALLQPAPAQPILTGEAAQRVDDYLTRLVPYGFSGAVLIAKDGQVVLRKGYGLANRAARQPYTADLVSSIGSITKQFTGAAIVKLEMQGKLNTTDPISKYLTGVPADKASITIHHLLTHTAGFAGDLGGGDAEPVGRDALVARVLAAPLASKPGERFEYSNEGYSLAGAIVEHVSGQGYEAFLREHLFLPAGMRNTGYLLPAWPLDRLPVGYREDGGEWGRIYKRGWLADGPGWYLRANGGIHSTLDDMYQWHVAIETHKVLSPEATVTYQTGHVPSLGGSERYAYGWGVQRTRRGTSVITHNGGNGIFAADVRRYVDEKVVIIAMTNQPVVPAPSLAPRQLEALFFGDATVSMPPAPLEVPASRREAITGIYELEGGGRLTMRATESGLEAESSDPLLFSELQLQPSGAARSPLEARSLSVLQDAAKGNFRPLFEAFSDDRPFEVVEGNQKKIWNDWRADFGAFAKAEALGTMTVQGDQAVIVRLHFARGGPVIRLVWGPKRLLGWRRVDAGAAPLVAEAPDTWTFYRYRLPQAVRLTFGGDGSVEIVRGDTRIRGRKRTARG